MGLTIHYKLHSDARSPREARRLVEELRKKAVALPLAEVGDIVELTGDACDYERYTIGRHPDYYWTWTNGGCFAEVTAEEYEAVKSIKGITRARVAHEDLRRCWS